MSSSSARQAAFICDNERNVKRVYGDGRRNEIEQRVRTVPGIIHSRNLADRAPELRDVAYLFSTWGMPALTVRDLAYLPSLQAVFYAAGSVQTFARPFLESGVQVISAWAANAVPVAEYTVAQITLAAKGFFTAARAGRGASTYASFDRDRYPGMFSIDIGVLGAGMIGTLVIRSLSRAGIRIHVFDPFMSKERERELDVLHEELDSVFGRCHIVSNHLANNAQTVGIIGRVQLERMPENGIFINTGRGATVSETDLVEVLTARPDLTALLDVTDPEPPEAGSPLYDLKNVVLTPHIAGSIGNEVMRQADYVIEEFDRFRSGQSLQYAVTLEMLPTMA